MSLSDDDKLLSFYNQELLALASQAMMPARLDDPVLTAHAVSPICGSEVDVDLVVQDSHIISFGYDVEACALTRAVVTIMKRAIIGKTRAEVAQAGAALSEMLAGGAAMPQDDWQALQILAPVRDYKARHNSILLPFEAVERAFKNSI